MGLDISVYKLINDSNKKKSNKFWGLNDKAIDEFKSHGLDSYISKKVRKYLDWQKYFNITEDELTERYRILGQTYGSDNHPNDVIWILCDKKHPGKDLYNKVYDLYCKNEDAIPLTPEDIQRLREFGYDKDIVEGEYSDLFVFVDDLITLRILQSTIPTLDKEDIGFYYEEIGYQRKGMKGEYYSAYRAGKFGYFVYDKETLLDLYENYVDEEDYDGNPTTQYKENFKEEILDKFVEGETIVGFDW